MQLPRIAFAFMLILALVPTLGVTLSNVSGQGYVTVTTQATTTALYTYPATTRSATTTETIYIYGPQHFSVNVCGEHQSIWGDHFSAIQGQRYHVNWTSEANISLDFYITTYFPGALSNSGPSCNNFPASEVIYSYRGATGSVDWVAPSTGQFIYWFLNPRLSTAGTISIETLNPNTFSTISYGSASTVEPVILTTIISQTNVNISQIGIPFANLGLLGAVVAIAVVAGVLVIARRRKTSVAASLVQERPVTVLESPKVAVAPQPVTPTRTIQPQAVISKIPRCSWTRTSCSRRILLMVWQRQTTVCVRHQPIFHRLSRQPTTSRYLQLFTLLPSVTTGNSNLRHARVRTYLEPRAGFDPATCRFLGFCYKAAALWSF
jgi:hypothetical protein